jgi:hypothetical protein
MNAEGFPARTSEARGRGQTMECREKIIKYEPIRTRLMVSVQRALLGQVYKRLGGVTCGLKGKTIVLRSYVEGPIRPEDMDRLQVISTEVITDFFDEGYTIEEECLTGKYEELAALDFWAYLRAPDEEWSE